MNKRDSVLFAANNPAISLKLKSDLEVLGYEVNIASHDELDMGSINESPPDIILIDSTICDFQTLSTCEMLLRNDGTPSGTVLAALVSEHSMGQIPLDYDFSEIILFPCDISELGFRLRRAIHLSQNNGSEDIMRIGNLTISPSRYEVKVKGKTVLLSHKEYELFKHLVTHPSHVFTREELFYTLWGNGQLGESRTVDVHIRRIRSKIGDLDHEYIKTVRGVGYTFRFENN